MYVFKRRLGSGGSADVFLYSRQTEGCPAQDVVLKVIKSNEEETFKELMNDGQKLSSLRHPHILSAFGFEKLSAGKFGLLLEYIDGCNLRQVISVMDSSARQKLAGYLVRTIIEALDSAHKHSVVHGDVSGRNILVSRQGIIKLSDFGLASDGGKEFSAKHFKGSVDYLAPELWKGGTRTYQSDIFSAGIVAYEILTGTNPLSASTLSQCRHRLSKFLEERPWRKWNLWEGFFDAVLHENPSERPSCQDLLERLPRFRDTEKECRDLLASHVNQAMTADRRDYSRTMTVLVDRFFGRATRKMSWVLSFCLTLVVLLGSRATGNGYEARHRLRSSTLTVTSRPWGEVFIDGVSVGYTPVIDRFLKSGYHRFIWKDFKGREVKKTLMAYENGIFTVRIVKTRSDGSGFEVSKNRRLQF